MKNAVLHRPLGAMELLSVCGFSLYKGWFLLSFIWLPLLWLPDVPQVESVLPQICVFFGLTLGVLIGIITSERFEEFVLRFPAFIIAALVGVLLPVLLFLKLNGTDVPLVFILLACLASGVLATLCFSAWGYICGRSRIRSPLFFTSTSSLSGVLLAFFGTLVSEEVRVLIAGVYFVLSIASFLFIGSKIPHQMTLDRETSRKHFTLIPNIAFSIASYYVVFGLATFICWSLGIVILDMALIAALLGAGIMSFVSWRRETIDLAIIQRFIIPIIVASALLIIFTPPEMMTAWLFLLVGALIASNIATSGLLMRQTIKHDLLIPYHLSLGFAAQIVGFFIGWTIGAVSTALLLDSSTIAFMLVALAFVVVLVAMIFLPNSWYYKTYVLGENHNEDDADHFSEDHANHDELLRTYCDKIARRHNLSARETDVLVFLAKGRNAEYIQGQLFISRGTIKTHISNIYRKTGIHSQQKLMDYIDGLSHSDAALK
ncbi:MAG: helix-turn-helix transcriptional regulator [Coriobacteriales bacterium]|jgi:DNA-binding CsgD family transcriptional regulator|nr:helix-turn-helix transcriptional regulator [Coriobacteriales bacterium]